jgi:hypothetical protein
MKFIKFLILFLTITLLNLTQLKAQDLKTKLCKTWVAYQYEEADGSKFPPLDEMKNDYLKLKKDGTYESLESGQLLIKGQWVVDSLTMTLTLSQNQVKVYPREIKTRITKITEKELTMVGKDGSGAKLTIYSRVKK